MSGPWYLESGNEGPNDLNQKLLAACHNVNETEVQVLLKSGALAAYERRDPGVWGASRTVSPLHIAIRKHQEMVSPDAMNIIKCLLEAGAKIDAKESEYDWRGCGGAFSAWEMAAQSENVELVRLFLRHGGDANSPSTYSRHSMRTDGRSEWYMIHTAVERNNVEMVKALVEGGANVI
jgi:ankyrin repeat protein